jgi:hypothetical protein
VQQRPVYHRYPVTVVDSPVFAVVVLLVMVVDSPVLAPVVLLVMAAGHNTLVLPGIVILVVPGHCS